MRKWVHFLIKKRPFDAKKGVFLLKKSKKREFVVTSLPTGKNHK